MSITTVTPREAELMLQLAVTQIERDEYQRAADSMAIAHKVERDALALDAERYRWLRNRIPGSAYRVAGIIYSEGGEGVDIAIDVAMKGKS